MVIKGNKKLGNVAEEIKDIDKTKAKEAFDMILSRPTFIIAVSIFLFIILFIALVMLVPECNKTVCGFSKSIDESENSGGDFISDINTLFTSGCLKDLE